MQVSLRGSSASTITVGILLLTHARRLGERVAVSIVGDAEDIATVSGPAVVYSPVLSGCGVGRMSKSNALVCVGGPASDGLVLSLEQDGISDWFEVDRSGRGIHPSSQAVIDLCRHSHPEGQNLGRVLRSALAAVGCPAEPALLDLLFGAPVDPLQRIALTLTAGRAMTGSEGDPFHRFVQSGVEDLPDPLPTPLTDSAYSEANKSGHLARLLNRAHPGVRESVEDWLNGIDDLEGGPKLRGLVLDIAEVGSFLLSLPMAGMLPKLTPAAGAVAGQLGEAIGKDNAASCAMTTLRDTYVFLGGQFVEHSPFAVEVTGSPPPSTRIDRWQWLCQSAALARDEAEQLWSRLVDPIQ